MECHAEIHEVLGDRAVPYRTEAFRSGRVSTADMHRSGCAVSVHTDMPVVIADQCMHEDRRWTVKELAELQSDSQGKADVAREMICRQRGHLNSNSAIGGTVRQLRLMVFAAFPIASSEPEITSVTTLETAAPKSL
jgi:hypothetical protein